MSVLQVVSVLTHMESTVSNFQEFVQCFSQFGSSMVQLAQLSGERQNASAAAKYTQFHIIESQY